jgi:glycosyltransferase involved in cell wall biosynthesis
MPVVTVVLPFWNAEPYLEDAVQSIRGQQLADWELVLVDDGSTDGSTEMAHDLAATDDRIRYIDHPGHQNLGSSASRNVGVAHGTAPYIAFIDADDVSMPNKLAEQVDLLENMPDVALVVGAIEYWYSWNPESTRANQIRRPGGIQDQRLDPPESLLAVYPLGALGGAGITGLVRRSAFDAVGGFEEIFRGLFDDQAFLAKIYLHFPIYISSRTWYRYRQHNASCVGGTSRIDHWRSRGAFLVWLETYVERFGDRRVIGAVQRARRQVRYGRLMVPAYEVFDRFPETLQRSVRALCGRT